MTKEELRPKCMEAMWPFGSCRKTDDLAQCPECHLWFCKQHDPHECIPQIAHLQERIASAKMRRDLGNDIKVWDFLAITAFLLIWEGFLRVLLPEDIVFGLAALFFISSVALFVPGFVIARYYGAQLQKFGVYSRSIRPQTAKEEIPKQTSAHAPLKETPETPRKNRLIVFMLLFFSLAISSTIYWSIWENEGARETLSMPTDPGDLLSGYVIFFAVVLCIVVLCYGVFIVLRSVARRMRSIRPQTA